MMVAIKTKGRHRRDGGMELKGWRLRLTTSLCSKYLSLFTVSAVLIHDK